MTNTKGKMTKNLSGQAGWAGEHEGTCDPSSHDAPFGVQVHREKKYTRFGYGWDFEEKNRKFFFAQNNPRGLVKAII